MISKKQMLINAISKAVQNVLNEDKEYINAYQDIDCARDAAKFFWKYIKEYIIDYDSLHKAYDYWFFDKGLNNIFNPDGTFKSYVDMKRVNSIINIDKDDDNNKFAALALKRALNVYFLEKNGSFDKEEFSDVKKKRDEYIKNKIEQQKIREAARLRENEYIEKQEIYNKYKDQFDNLYERINNYIKNTIDKVYPYVNNSSDMYSCYKSREIKDYTSFINYLKRGFPVDYYYMTPQCQNITGREWNVIKYGKTIDVELYYMSDPGCSEYVYIRIYLFVDKNTNRVMTYVKLNNETEKYRLD